MSRNDPSHRQAAHYRPRVCGVDRELAVTWRTNQLTWRRLAAQPLSRAIGTIVMLGDESRANITGLTAFVRTSNVQVIRGVPRRLHARTIAALGRTFAFVDGALRRK